MTFDDIYFPVKIIAYVFDVIVLSMEYIVNYLEDELNCTKLDDDVVMLVPLFSYEALY